MQVCTSAGWDWDTPSYASAYCSQKLEAGWVHHSLGHVPLIPMGERSAGQSVAPKQ